MAYVSKCESAAASTPGSAGSPRGGRVAGRVHQVDLSVVRWTEFDLIEEESQAEPQATTR